MTDNENVAARLDAAYENLKRVDLAGAAEALDQALALDFEHPEVLYALKCLGFWRERIARIESIKEPFERGESVMAQWKLFSTFQRKLGGNFAPAGFAPAGFAPAGFAPGRFAFRHYAFSLALSCYAAIPPEEREANEAEYALRIGRCKKGRGDYAEALESFEAAARARRDDAEILAELADAYALVNEVRSSKALFREAFFINASRIDVELLESELIARLAERVSSVGHSGQELLEWIPVYGAVLGVFNVKRELKALEAGKLRQSIYQLENEARESLEKRSVLVPRLLNRYFWLVDHYVNTGEEKAAVDEVLLKIKLLDAGIYKLYTA